MEAMLALQRMKKDISEYIKTHNLKPDTFDKISLSTYLNKEHYWAANKDNILGAILINTDIDNYIQKHNLDHDTFGKTYTDQALYTPREKL